jgi:hypothetical protein
MENPFHSITIAEVIFPVNPEPHPKLNPIPWSTPSIPPIISKLKNELPQKFKGGRAHQAQFVLSATRIKSYYLHPFVTLSKNL